MFGLIHFVMASNNQLDFAWHETADDATAAAIHKSGKNMKALAHELWPHLKMETAYASLRAALNPEQPRKLTADEHIRIGNLTNQYDFLHYCAQECHHSRPEPVAPEDERDAINRKVLRIAGELRPLLDRLGRLEGDE